MSDFVTITEHLYLTEDRARVVKENDRRGRWLWATPGMQVLRVEAERLGAVEPQQSARPVVDQGEAKRGRQPADKHRSSVPNKGK